METEKNICEVCKKESEFARFEGSEEKIICDTCLLEAKENEEIELDDIDEYARETWDYISLKWKGKTIYVRRRTTYDNNCDFYDTDNELQDELFEKAYNRKLTAEEREKVLDFVGGLE